MAATVRRRKRPDQITCSRFVYRVPTKAETTRKRLAHNRDLNTSILWQRLLFTFRAAQEAIDRARQNPDPAIARIDIEVASRFIRRIDRLAITLCIPDWPTRRKP